MMSAGRRTLRLIEVQVNKKGRGRFMLSELRESDVLASRTLGSLPRIERHGLAFAQVLE